jgi:hypothetical protein
MYWCAADALPTSAGSDREKSRLSMAIERVPTPIPIIQAMARTTPTAVSAS